jgi:hypothetical protein
MTIFFCVGFFHVVVLVLLAKQQQQKIVNLYTISVCYAWALGYNRQIKQNIFVSLLRVFAV